MELQKHRVQNQLMTLHQVCQGNAILNSNVDIVSKKASNPSDFYDTEGCP